MQISWTDRMASATEKQVSPARLVRAAQEFEGQMMKELLKPMTDSHFMGDESGSSGVLGEFAGEALGQALSRQGGFGIADRIIASFSHSGQQSQTAAK